MKIIIDAFGGDNSPQAVIEGAALAAAEYGAQIALTGDAEKIRAAAGEQNIDISALELIDAKSVVSMHDDPKCVLRAKSDSSMAVGLKLLADGQADAFVSAGSTAALLMGATLIVKRIKGVKRPALASVIPASDGCFMLLDCGANTETRPEMLVQFAKMGSVYMNRIEKVENPRTALVSNGTEETKGTDQLREAYKILQNEGAVNFTGYVEARELPLSGCDVAVTDGFCGNLVLKTMEGMGIAMYGRIKKVFLKNAVSKLAALVVKPGLRDFKHSMDSTERGGAPLLGVSRTVIKAHGSSNAKAIKNAVRQAIACCEQNICGVIADAVSGDSEE